MEALACLADLGLARRGAVVGAQNCETARASLEGGAAGAARGAARAEGVGAAVDGHAGGGVGVVVDVVVLGSLRLGRSDRGKDRRVAW